MVPFGTLPVTRRRYVAQVTDPVTRKPVSQIPAELIVYASIQPPTDRDLQTLSDGERTRRVLVLFVAPDTFRTSEPTTRIPSDEVAIDGEIFQVRGVEKWRQVMPHDRAVCVRRQEIGP